jgi:fructosamine-3-kinase
VSNTLGLVLKDGSRSVIKISPHRVDRTLMREAQQLAHLRMLGVPVPTVYGFRLASLDEPDSWLLMEWREGKDLAAVKALATPEQFEKLQGELAEVVLMMHQQIGPAYMRVGCDDQEVPEWHRFFSGIYDPMWLDLEKDPSTSRGCKKAFNKIRENLPRLLDHPDKPRLVHWDLWSGNVLAAQDNGGFRISSLLDPICKYAHAEAELAYLEMFQTVTKTFLDEYKRVLRPDDGYFGLRRQVYQLYFLMDHACFFGGQYHKKLEEASERLAGKI